MGGVPAGGSGAGLPEVTRHGIIPIDRVRVPDAEPDVGAERSLSPPTFPEACPMAALAADRDLLFGLLALQNGLITQVQLGAPFRAWPLDKARPLAAPLVGRGDLDADDRPAADALVARHLKKHGGDVERSLAATPA